MTVIEAEGASMHGTSDDQLGEHEVVSRLELIADKINTKDSIDAVMASMVSAVLAHTPWTQCWVALVDIPAKKVVVDYYGGFDPSYENALREWDLDGTITLDVARTHGIITIANTEQPPPQYAYFADAARISSSMAVMHVSVPFERADRCVVFAVNLPYAHEFTTAEITLARGIATFAAIAFRNVLATEQMVELQAVEQTKLAHLNTAISQKNNDLMQLSAAQTRLLRLQAVGADVASICAEISELTAMPVLLLDPFVQPLEMVAFASEHAEAVIRHVTQQSRSHAFRIETRPAMALINDRPHMITNVVEDNTLVAIIVLQIVDGDEPNELQLRLIELSRVHVSLMVRRVRASFETEARFVREFVDALGGGGSDLSITQTAGMVGLSLQAANQVLIARISGLSPALPRRYIDELGQFVASRLRQTGAPLFVAPLSGNEFTIVLSDTPVWRSARVTDRVRSAVAEGANLIDPATGTVQVAIGIGTSLIGVEGLRRSHYQALRALEITLASGHADSDLSFEEAGTAAILAAIPTDDRNAFLSRYLKPLIHYDSMHGTPLIETLETYFESIGNVPRTADRLFLHVSTVRYRLRRVEELAGISLDDQEDRLRLQLCLRLIRLTGSLP
ncbi:helix-turn-helix domain-containing protein [bacterium RCC_150]